MNEVHAGGVSGGIGDSSSREMPFGERCERLGRRPWAGEGLIKSHVAESSPIMMIFGCAITDCGSSLVSTHTHYAFLLTGFPVPRYLLAEQKMPNAIRDPRDMEYRSAPNFAIIGCGLAGKKRAAVLPPGALQVTCDSSLLRAEEIARRLKGCRATDNSKEAITDPNVDVVIVSTPHAALRKIALSAVRAGKHVLVEKPGAINSGILKQIESEAAKTGSLVRIGFNHRDHPAFQKANALVREKALVPPTFIRVRCVPSGNT